MTPTELFLTNRRDGLLLLLLQGTILAWGWEQGALAALGASLVTAALFTLLLTLFHQSRLAATALTGAEQDKVLAVTQWAGILLALGTLPTTLLVARAIGQGLGSRPLMMLLALLTLGWQVWLSFWTADEPPPPHKEE